MQRPTAAARAALTCSAWPAAQRLAAEAGDIGRVDEPAALSLPVVPVLLLPLPVVPDVEPVPLPIEPLPVPVVEPVPVLPPMEPVPVDGDVDGVVEGEGVPDGDGVGTSDA